MKKFVTEHNCITGETITREMTKDEQAQSDLDKKIDAELIAIKESKIQAKSALLAKLGITEDEAKLLLG